MVVLVSPVPCWPHPAETPRGCGVDPARERAAAWAGSRPTSSCPAPISACGCGVEPAFFAALLASSSSAASRAEVVSSASRGREDGSGGDLPSAERPWCSFSCSCGDGDDKVDGCCGCGGCGRRRCCCCCCGVGSRRNGSCGDPAAMGVVGPKRARCRRRVLWLVTFARWRAGGEDPAAAFALPGAPRSMRRLAALAGVGVLVDTSQPPLASSRCRLRQAFAAHPTAPSTSGAHASIVSMLKPTVVGGRLRG